MDRLEKIKKPLEGDMEKYKDFMRSALYSESGYVTDIMDYIITSGGKGIRPVLVMLCAGLHAHGKGIGKRAYLAAMLVELIHNASLVHDDVVDGSDTRHGKPTVHTRWNTKVAVLAGDYILARSFAVGMQSGQFDIVSYIAGGISELAEGELIQNDHNMRRDITREKYMEVIFKKTATLLGISCGAGALASGATMTEAGIARQIGINLGLAFQIKDDILDYSPSRQTGKPEYADLREGKITLPLIAVLERADEPVRRDIIDRVERGMHDESLLGGIADLVRCEGGMEAASEVMHEYLDRARDIIAAYPESDYRASLLEMCDYIGVRDK